ncbi:GNAT family N-acetyltransferase [Microaceticoccus formicicus]|uniref:GNAT family N-acetyltransferase n=1 Tax=Microaceticoccus formicicus TaxID=3118105 RepID=UPI003CD04209|nr:GNAT family N-acetyltransferase [Peptoniphilaceae bacterium AMB_02]
MYKKIEDKLKANGVKVIKLGVLENNQPALKFWKMNGFKILDKKTSTVVNQKISSFYLMAKDI